MKNALVTGANGELGREIIARLNDLDYQVYAFYKNRDSFEKIFTNNKKVIGISCNLLDQKSIDEAIGQVTGQLDLIVTTASPPVPFEKFSKISKDKILEDINVIYIGNAFVILGLLDKLKEGSKIVNVLTSAINSVPQGMGSYIAAKFALLGFSKVMEKELKSRKIQVICTYPPMMDTKLIHMVPAQLRTNAIKPSIVADHMVGLFTGLEDIEFDLKNEFKTKEIAIDMEITDRFRLDKESPFVLKYFSKGEIDYCFSKTNPEIHLAAFFCIKECYFKLTNEFSEFAAIEIDHEKSGRPYLKINGLGVDDKFKISISHVKDYSIGILLRDIHDINK